MATIPRFRPTLATAPMRAVPMSSDACPLVFPLVFRFLDEYREILTKFEVEFDERFVFKSVDYKVEEI
jgi:hypothetical protein